MGRPPERVWCATPLSWLGRTGWPSERVRCATPFFCFAGVVALPHALPCSPSAFSCPRCSRPCAGVCIRLLLRPPHPTPAHPAPLLVVFCPPFCFLVSRAYRQLCPPPPPPPPPGGLRFAAGGVLLRIYPSCLCAFRLLCTAWPFLGASCCPTPPPLGLCFAGVVALPLVCLCSPSVFSWFRAAWPFVPPPSPRFLFPGCRRPAPRFPVSSCCCLVFSVPLALAPTWLGFFFLPRLAAFRAHCALRAGAPPPPLAVAPDGVRCPASCCVVPRLGVGCFVRRSVFCCAVSCCCASAWLCGVLFCCVFGFVVGRLPLALAAPFLLMSHGAPLRRAVSSGVSSCVVPSCVVVCCGAFFVAVWCQGRGLFFTPCLLGSAHLRVCAAWYCPPLVCVSCLLPVCVALLCWLVLCSVVLCCCLVCCVVRGAACRVVLCRVLLCFAGGMVPRCVSSWGCAVLHALPCSVVLCCVVVHCAVCCSAASWCSVLCCPAVCCCGLLCAIWCPFALCGWLCAVLCCCLLLCAVLRLWAWCLVALCCAVLVVACCFVLVALLCAVLCLLVLCWAVLRRVVLCGAGLLCTVLSDGAVLHCLAVCGAASCCAVPSAAVRCLGCCVLCCVLCCAVLCCCVLCCALGCGVLVRCAVLFVLCLAVWSGSVFPCVVLCLLVLCCAALRRDFTCGAVLLCTVIFAWCCAVFARAFWCCCVLCPALGCRAVLWGAVLFRAALCCVALCCVRCAVRVLPLCCGVCCFLLLSVVLLAPCGVALCARLPLCIFKNRKNCFPFSKTEKIVSRWCLALCTLSSLDATIPHTENTKPACFIYLSPGVGLVCTAGLVLELFGCVLGVFDTVHLQRKGGQTRRGWGSSGTRRYMENKKKGARVGESRGVTR